eukprot:923462-Amphidinium_carterae.1
MFGLLALQEVCAPRVSLEIALKAHSFLLPGVVLVLMSGDVGQESNLRSIPKCNQRNNVATSGPNPKNYEASSQNIVKFLASHGGSLPR